MKISFGCKVLDNFLEGGFDSDGVTIIYGPASSGKTTICMTAAIALARQGKKTVFIDTENGFSVERLKQLCGDDFRDIFSNIVLVHPRDFSEQRRVIWDLDKMRNISLIVVDTMTFFYRYELSKDALQFKLFNESLIEQATVLSDLSRENNIPILLTNQVYSDFENNDDVKMVGGEILKNRSCCILKLENIGPNKRKVKLMLADKQKEIEFKIKNEGISDYSSLK